MDVQARFMFARALEMGAAAQEQRAAAEALARRISQRRPAAPSLPRPTYSGGESS
jgi:acyl-CoA hydrolase